MFWPFVRLCLLALFGPVFAPKTPPSPPILPFYHGSGVGSSQMPNYLLAKISPMGKYRVIIFDQLVTESNPLSRWEKKNRCKNYEVFDLSRSQPKERKFMFRYEILSEMSVEELAKCFVHLYVVDTDEEGRFLVLNGEKSSSQLSINLVPMEEDSNAIHEAGTLVAVQQSYVLQKKHPVDELCHWHDDIKNRCLVNYYEGTGKREELVGEMLGKWLIGDILQMQKMRKEKFFLVANLRDLLKNVKANRETRNPIDLDDAKLIVLYWKALVEAQQSGKLLYGLKEADPKMDELITGICTTQLFHLCRQQLQQQHLRISKGNAQWEPQPLMQQLNGTDTDAFCAQWQTDLQKLEHLEQIPAILEGFRQWLDSEDRVEAETAQIVQYWTRRLASGLTEFNKSIMEQIGPLFVAAHDAGKLTMDKLEQIDGVLANLARICQRLDNGEAWRGNGRDPRLRQWSTVLCVLDDRGERYLVSVFELRKSILAAQQQQQTSYSSRPAVATKISSFSSAAGSNSSSSSSDELANAGAYVAMF